MWRRPNDSSDDRKLLLDLVRMVMGMDDKIDRVLRALGLDDGQEEMDS